MERFRKSAEPVLPPLDSPRVGFIRGESPLESAWEISAVDRGETVSFICYFRRLYGDGPRQFCGYFLELTAKGPVLRQQWLFIVRRRIAIPEELLSAHVRPFESQQEARRFASTGIYAPGAAREWDGSSIVSCQTPVGEIEFGVGRRHVRVLLHYIKVLRRRTRKPPEAVG